MHLYFRLIILNFIILGIFCENLACLAPVDSSRAPHLMALSEEDLNMLWSEPCKTLNYWMSSNLAKNHVFIKKLDQYVYSRDRSMYKLSFSIFPINVNFESTLTSKCQSKTISKLKTYYHWINYSISNNNHKTQVSIKVVLRYLPSNSRDALV